MHRIAVAAAFFLSGIPTVALAQVDAWTCIVGGGNTVTNTRGESWCSGGNYNGQKMGNSPPSGPQVGAITKEQCWAREGSVSATTCFVYNYKTKVNDLYPVYPP